MENILLNKLTFVVYLFQKFLTSLEWYVYKVSTKSYGGEYNFGSQMNFKLDFDNFIESGSSYKHPGHNINAEI
jgi:hypothetical protein